MCFLPPSLRTDVALRHTSSPERAMVYKELLMVMPPPANSAYLRAYIDNLKLEAEALAYKESARPAGLENPTETYAYQILSWVTSLPESQQKQAYTMSSIIKLANLRGIYTESASPQKIAPALRKAGFKQIRSWKKIDRNIRLWVWESNKN